MRAPDSVLALWHDFKKSAGVAVSAFDFWHFADNEADANELAALVLAGTKRATAPALWSFEFDQEPVPEPGDFSVVTSWAGEAVCIICTTRVDIVAYENVTAVFAEIEGEGDKSLAYWQSVHWPYYRREMNRIGKSLSPALPVVCQQFELVYPLNRA